MRARPVPARKPLNCNLAGTGPSEFDDILLPRPAVPPPSPKVALAHEHCPWGERHGFDRFSGAVGRTPEYLGHKVWACHRGSTPELYYASKEPVVAGAGCELGVRRAPPAGFDTTMLLASSNTGKSGGLDPLATFHADHPACSVSAGRAMGDTDNIAPRRTARQFQHRHR